MGLGRLTNGPFVNGCYLPSLPAVTLVLCLPRGLGWLPTVPFMNGTLERHDSFNSMESLA